MDRPLLTARLKRSLPLSADTRHLEFEAEGIDRFDFVAGQFISVVVPNEAGKQVTRAYSLASAPRGDRSFDLCLNRIQDGFMSNYLCDLPEGAILPWHGPHGLFTVREPIRDSIFIATGTGVAPIRGMLEWLFADHPTAPENAADAAVEQDLLPRHANHEFWLVFGTRYEQDIYYRDEFEDMARRHPNFRYVVTLSREEDWNGPRGYVQEHVAEIVASRPNSGVGNTTAYICGLNAMVSANRELLKSLGWDRKQIVYERYD
jgi:ferredoxin-NADP reductase